jgi:hypothetical protein
MWFVMGFILLTTVVSLMLDTAMKETNYAEQRCRYNNWS